MRQWISPEINVLDIKDTSWGSHGGWVNYGSWHHGGWNGNVGGNNPLPPGQDDIGGCNDNFWEGNGLSWEERREHNPFWEDESLS